MIKRLRLSSIWSEDLNNLLPFHRDVLGLRPGLETPGFVVLGDPEAPAVAFGTHSDVRGRASEPAHHIVGFETDDIAKEYRRLEEAGVERVGGAQGLRQRVGGDVRGSGGNVLQLLQFQR